MVRSFFPSIQSVTNWLCTSVPSFPVKADQVSILYKPDEFYDTLRSSCSKATRRILLVSLYLGTGEKERKLVEVIQSRAFEQGSSLKVQILLDAVRGSRDDGNSSRKMLLPLLKQNPHCQVALFHTPKLKGILRSFLPQRYNELIGLQHMKIYIVDDNVMISGANLSHDYFTNRQDRYVIVKNCKHLADFFDGMINILCDMSFQLNDSNVAIFPARTYHPYKGSTNVFVKELRNRISNYYSSFINSSARTEDSDTWIFPTIEIPPCDIHFDTKITKHLLESVPENSFVHLATGYFNLTESLVDAVLSSKAKFNILMAHPTANGFYQSPGFSQHIPTMYTSICKEFYDKVENCSSSDRVASFEYKRKDWTFHGKGIWVTFPKEILPQLTIVGSSNFGVRSEKRDLESQIIIVTNDINLRKKLFREQQILFEYGMLVSRTVFSEAERKIPLWINGFSWLLRSFF